MTKILFPLVVVIITLCSCMGSSSGTASREKAAKDSVAHARKLADSLKMAKLFSIAQYPHINGGKWSGVIPVADPTELPDPGHDYRLLFELTAKNPDSLSKDINRGLTEVARVLNLHVASGIPASRIIPVVVLHGPGIEAVMNSESYRKRHSIDNPNVKLVHDLENAGSKIIVCGQAMAFFGITREELLPEIKISLTAQTVLSNYQSRGFVLYSIEPDR